MNWFTQFFEGQSIAWLLISTIIALFSGFISSWLTYRFVKRQEIIDATTIQGEIRKEVETYLGDKSAEREYELEARKHLYKAIGPLRFQLVIACRDASSRINNYGTGKTFDMTMKGYYGLSTLYRVVRPIAIVELIEQQVAYTDFSVDQTAIEILRFKRAVYKTFTDGDPILKHPDANWNSQTEHLFTDTLSRIANSLVILDKEANNKKRPMSYTEFRTFSQNSENLKKFSPLTRILENFQIRDMPIFWARLVCFGNICNEYVRQAGNSIGFEYNPIDLSKLLLASKDDYILSNSEKYQETFRSLVEIGL